MTPAESLKGLATTTTVDIVRSPKLRTNVINDELQWRRKPPGEGGSASSASRVTVTRWRSLEHRTREVRAETPLDGHIVAVVLRNENVLFSVSGRTVHEGAVTPGAFHITEPAAPTHCLFRGPYDVLHLHVPNRVITEICCDLPNYELTPFRPQHALARDPALDRLARALAASEQIGGSYGELYADNLSIAIVARLLRLNGGEASQRPRVGELPKWRLKRATEYIEASLADSVRLVDIASAAGLTRMHFAAQFRATTGLRPHEYLLRRRIERAQEKLAGTSMSLVEVARSVGFQTQTHFTNVFKRMVGQPPQAWRLAQDKTASCDFGIPPSRSYSNRLVQPC